ncbi:MAG TPA: alpha/beta hydrolase [Thermoanaerobaculia bacterium]|nr:alpha/beta hydrolase [Thermoanaerobaculia bacterium]
MNLRSRGLGIALALTTPVFASDPPSAATLRSAFEAQFPKAEASAAALELERLAASLGFDLAPRDNSVPVGEAPSGGVAEPAPFTLNAERARSRPSAEAQAAFQGIKAAVFQFLDRELKSADERIAAPPPAVERYFSEHESLLSAAESLLLREPDVRWEMDFSRPEAAPIPNLLGIMTLQRLFVARALLQERDGETEAALTTLDAAWRLNAVVSSRPELISQLITVAAAKLHVGALRKLDDPAQGWADRVRDGEFYARFLAAFQNQVWQTSRDVQDLTGESGAFGRILRKMVAAFQEGDLCAWTAERLQETWARAAQGESTEEEMLATIAAPNLMDSFLRWRRHRIDSELTALVLDARSERAGSPRRAWPAKLPAAGARVCPNEPWSYRPARNGTATFAFEGRISESSAPLQLPLRFTAGALSKKTTQAKQGFVVADDGVRLFYRRIGDGPRTFLVLHGGPGSNMNGVWPDLEPLASAGRSIILYDQRGGGRSQVVKDPARLTAAHHVRDLEAVRAHFRLERFTLVGESWGAGLAALYAAEHPARVDRLLLLGPMPPTREILEQRMDDSDTKMGFRTRLADVSRRMANAADPISVCKEFFSLYLPQFFVRPETVARRRASSCNAPAEGVRNYFVVNKATLDSLGAFDFRPALTRLTMPAMVVEGEKSISSTVESARVFAESIPGAALLLVPEAGHFPQVENPDAFFPAVEKFLNSSVRKEK